MSLDREIEDLLAVDPSRDFVARVRQRVAEEPVPGRSWFSWKLVPVGVGLAAVALAVILFPDPADPTREHPIAPTMSRVIASTSAASAATADKPTRELVVAPTSAADAATAGKPTRNAGIAPPQLVLSAEEQRAFRLLLMTIDEDVLPEVPVQEAAVSGPAWIHIEPVAITPIGDSGAE